MHVLNEKQMKKPYFRKKVCNIQAFVILRQLNRWAEKKK